MKVAIADRNLEGAKATAKDFNEKHGDVAIAVQIDVIDWESQRSGFQNAVDKFGHIDYVFAVAGIPERPWLANKPDATTFEKPDLSVFDVNASGVLYTSALAIQQMRRQEPNKFGFRGKSMCLSTSKQPE